jgi:tetratricopeptide (TPR) repeat protein
LAPRPASRSPSKRYNKGVRIRFLIVFVALLATSVFAQDPTNNDSAGKTATDKPADSNQSAGESSSRDTRVDLSPPRDDAKSHPGSKDAVADLDAPPNPDKDDKEKADTSGVQEFHPWNPLKAAKDIEVGDYYFKRKNYKGALERYKDALYYKDGDAVASFRLAVCQEKLGDKTEARKYYEQYLKILPQGPFAKDAHASLDRLAKAQ